MDSRSDDDEKPPEDDEKATEDDEKATEDDEKPTEDDEAEAEAKETDSVPAKSPPEKSEGKARKRSGSKARRAEARRETKSDARTETRQRPSAALSSPWSRVLAAAALALAAGGAAGWFGHDAQAKAKLRAEAAPAASGSSGPCGAWEQKICESSGDQSAACEQAKSATGLLTPGTCEVALAAVPATLAKVKAARASCEELVTKLCNDLPKGSEACKMVTERTPSLPSDRCKDMLGHYDEVLGQLKAMDQQQGGPPMGGSPHGPPPGAMPHGGPPPGAMPRGRPPQ